MAGFAAQVSRFVRQTEARMDTVVKESAQRVISIAQTPRSEGGRMPVVTGFLRNTGSVAVNVVPSGPARNQSSDAGEWDIGDTQLTIANARPGDTIYFGWSAIYARRMEEKYGFVEAVAMQWPSIVAQVAREVEQRIVG